MFYYAYLNEEDICMQIYSLPAPISGTQFIAISSNDETLVGQLFNREKGEFEPVYYYAVIDNRGIVTSVTYSVTPLATSATLLAITFAQYQTVTGLYWNGTDFVTPPISVMAIASTDEINYKGEEKWLSKKLDEMETATSTNATDISTLSNCVKTTANAVKLINESLATLNTAVEGKANATHTHTATDITGVVKTVNGNTPDENGNITITSEGIDTSLFATNEAFAKLATAVEELDIQLDLCSTDVADIKTELGNKAEAVHTHDEYATTESVTELTETVATIDEAIGLLDTAIKGIDATLTNKAEADHTHDEYALADHTHTGYATSDIVAALANTMAVLDSDVITLSNQLNGKSDTDHTHNEYAPTNHTHSNYLSTAGGTINGNLGVNGILRINGQQTAFDSGTMLTLSTNNRETMIAGSKVYSKTAISVSSDERLKENIREFTEEDTEDAVEFINGIDVKTFNYINNDENNIGVIAQELIKVNPDMAKYFIRTDDKGYYSVKASDLVFPLIVAVQELYNKVEK